MATIGYGSTTLGSVSGNTYRVDRSKMSSSQIRSIENSYRQAQSQAETNRQEAINAASEKQKEYNRLVAAKEERRYDREEAISSDMPVTRGELKGVPTNLGIGRVENPSVTGAVSSTFDTRVEVSRLSVSDRQKWNDNERIAKEIRKQQETEREREREKAYLEKYPAYTGKLAQDVINEIRGTDKQPDKPDISMIDKDNIVLIKGDPNVYFKKPLTPQTRAEFMKANPNAAITPSGILPKGTQKAYAMAEYRVQSVDKINKYDQKPGMGTVWNLTPYGGGMSDQNTPESAMELGFARLTERNLDRQIRERDKAAPPPMPIKQEITQPKFGLGVAMSSAAGEVFATQYEPETFEEAYAQEMGQSVYKAPVERAPMNLDEAVLQGQRQSFYKAPEDTKLQYSNVSTSRSPSSQAYAQASILPSIPQTSINPNSFVGRSMLYVGGIDLPLIGKLQGPIDEVREVRQSKNELSKLDDMISKAESQYREVESKQRQYVGLDDSYYTPEQLEQSRQQVQKLRDVKYKAPTSAELTQMEKDLYSADWWQKAGAGVTIGATVASFGWGLAALGSGVSATAATAYTLRFGASMLAADVSAKAVKAAIPGESFAENVLATVTGIYFGGKVFNDLSTIERQIANRIVVPEVRGIDVAKMNVDLIDDGAKEITGVIQGKKVQVKDFYGTRIPADKYGAVFGESISPSGKGSGILISSSVGKGTLGIPYSQTETVSYVIKDSIRSARPDLLGARIGKNIGAYQLIGSTADDFIYRLNYGSSMGVKLPQPTRGVRLTGYIREGTRDYTVLGRKLSSTIDDVGLSQSYSTTLLEEAFDKGDDMYRFLSESTTTRGGIKDIWATRGAQTIDKLDDLKWNLGKPNKIVLEDLDDIGWVGYHELSTDIIGYNSKSFEGVASYISHKFNLPLTSTAKHEITHLVSSRLGINTRLPYSTPKGHILQEFIADFSSGKGAELSMDRAFGSAYHMGKIPFKITNIKQDFSLDMVWKGNIPSSLYDDAIDELGKLAAIKAQASQYKVFRPGVVGTKFAKDLPLNIASTGDMSAITSFGKSLKVNPITRGYVPKPSLGVSKDISSGLIKINKIVSGGADDVVMGGQTIKNTGRIVKDLGDDFGGGLKQATKQATKTVVDIPKFTLPKTSLTMAKTGIVSGSQRMMSATQTFNAASAAAVRQVTRQQTTPKNPKADFGYMMREPLSPQINIPKNKGGFGDVSINLPRGGFMDAGGVSNSIVMPKLYQEPAVSNKQVLINEQINVFEPIEESIRIFKFDTPTPIPPIEEQITEPIIIEREKLITDPIQITKTRPITTPIQVFKFPTAPRGRGFAFPLPVPKGSGGRSGGGGWFNVGRWNKKNPLLSAAEAFDLFSNDIFARPKKKKKKKVKAKTKKKTKKKKVI